MQVIQSTHRLVSDSDDQIAFTHSSKACRSVCVDSDYLYSILMAEIMEPYQTPVQTANATHKAEVTTPHSPLSDQLGHHQICGIGGDSEANSLGHCYYCSINSHQVATGVN